MNKILKGLNEVINGRVTLEKTTLPTKEDGYMIVVDEIYKTRIFLPKELIEDVENDNNEDKFKELIIMLGDEINMEISKK